MIKAQIEDEKYWVSEWLVRHGTAFSACLGEALMSATYKEANRIKKAFPEIWKAAYKSTLERRQIHRYY